MIALIPWLAVAYVLGVIGLVTVYLCVGISPEMALALAILWPICAILAPVLLGLLALVFACTGELGHLR